MTSAASFSGEPVVPSATAAGSTRTPELAPALAIARVWAGDGLIALVLAGSHATGESVRIQLAGRPVTLSDLDVYAVMRDESACDAARARQHADAGAADRLRSLGFLAPLETAFVTRAGLGRLPPRPGSIELVRSGRVVEGDASVLADAPRWSAAEVPVEERLLLLENRGFELLLGRPCAGADEAARALARHATLKAAADLAGVLALARGEWPDGTAGRMAWARAHAWDSFVAALPAVRQEAAEALPVLWETALEWRRGEAPGLAPAAADREWRAAAGAWCAVWWAEAARHGSNGRDPWEQVRRVAARAPLPRRLRRALAAVRPGARAEPFAAGLRYALAGTPQHRINGSAAVLLFAAADSSGAPALPAGALRALRALGVTRASDWERARRDVVAAWDERVLGGGGRAGATA